MTTVQKTPVNKIHKRVLQTENVTPLRRSSLLNRTPFQRQDDDEAERSKRRSLAEMQNRISNIHPPRPESPAINDAELKSHFQICIKMFAENKITSKNAWNLKIIDYMRTMLRSHGMALQVASTTLDISAKVYGIRVDDIHSDGMKLASNFSRISHKETNDVEIAEEEGGEENEVTKKKKKPRRLSTVHKSTISKDPQSLLSDIAKLPSTSFSSTDASGKLFTNQLPFGHSGCEFMMLNKSSSWINHEDDDSLESMAEFSVDLRFPNVPICAAFATFEIDQWDPLQEDILLGSRTDDVVYDEEGIPLAELDGSMVDELAGTDDNNTSEDEGGGIGCMRGNELENIVDFNPENANVAGNDYSYCQMNQLITQIWAGPSHWKLKHIKPAVSKCVSQNMERLANARRNTRRVKVEAMEVDVYNPRKPLCDLKVLTTQRREHSHPDSSKFTLPPYTHTEPDLKTRLICKPVCLNTSEDKAQSNEEFEVSPYNYDNPNDSQYCSQNMVDDNGDGDHHEEEMAAENNLFGENLVPVPELVEQVYIPYSLQAKKMDMRKLKMRVWECLIGPQHEGMETEEQLQQKIQETSFSDLYKQLPSKLSPKMKTELSCPLAFVALLHLANEQNLKITPHQDPHNFYIMQDKKPLKSH